MLKDHISQDYISQWQDTTIHVIVAPCCSDCQYYEVLGSECTSDICLIHFTRTICESVKQRRSRMGFSNFDRSNIDATFL